MLFAFAVLLVFQCVGEAISHALALPVPGPVIGMLLLFVALLASPALMARVEATGNALLSHLSLLFVPAGAGIVATAGSVQGHWLAVIASLVGGTLLTLSVTALVVKTFWRDDPAEDGAAVASVRTLHGADPAARANRAARPAGSSDAP